MQGEYKVSTQNDDYKVANYLIHDGQGERIIQAWLVDNLNSGVLHATSGEVSIALAEPQDEPDIDLPNIDFDGLLQ